MFQAKREVIGDPRMDKGKVKEQTQNQTFVAQQCSIFVIVYFFFHNHGRGEWLYLKGN